MDEKPGLFEFFAIALGAIIMLQAVISTIMEFFRKKKPKVEASPEKEEVEELEDMFDGDEEEEVHELRAPPPIPMPERHYELPPQKEWVAPEEKYTFHTKVEDLHPKSAIDERHLAIGLHRPDEVVTLTHIADAPRPKPAEQVSDVRRILGKFATKKELIIASEILLPPLGFRKR
jgi:hypothetical protein